MDEYKTIYRNAAVPSLCFFLASAGTSAFVYGLTLGHRSDILAGYIMLSLWMLSLYPVYRTSLREPDENAGTNNRKRLAILLILSCITSAVTWYSTVEIIGESGPAGKFIVERITIRRYDKELTLRSADGPAAIRAIGTAPLDADIREGDTISPDTPPKAVQGTDGFQRSLLRKGIRYRVYLDENNYQIENRSGPGLHRVIRSKCDAQIESLFSPDTAPLISALYFGGDDHLDRRILINFKRAGVLHILAASGFNVGIVAFIPITILGLFRLNRKIIAAVCQLVLVGYFMISDMPVSLFRAVLMALVFALFFITDLKRGIINILFLSASIIIMFYPYELYNPGFQLSVGATLGILLFFTMFRDTLSRLPAPIANSLALTFSAQIPVIPIIAIYMGEFNAAGLFSNLAVIPLTSGIIYCSLLANALHPVLPSLASAAAAITDALCRCSVTAVSHIASLNLHYTISPFHPGLICILLLMSAPLVPPLRKKGAAAAMLALSAALPVLVFSESIPDSPMVFNDKGSMALLMKGRDETALIGTIGDISTARVIVKATEKMSGRGLSLYLPDTDYKTLQAYAYIARNVPIESCTLSSGFRFTGSLKRFLSVLDRDGVKIRIQPLSREGRNFKKCGNFTLDSQMEIMQVYYSIRDLQRKNDGGPAPP